jgi:hypothetical protein
MPVKPHLIKEPPKHVHQIPPFQNKQMPKDLIKFAKFKCGRVVMVLYWVDQSTSQGVFPKKTLSKSCSEYKVDGGMTFGHGVLDISRCHIVSFMASFAMQPFSKPFYLSLIYYDLSIECYVQWKVKSTAMPLGVRNTLSAICIEN